MRGAVVERGKTYSFVLLRKRDPDTGRNRQRWIGGFTTKRACEAALAEAVGWVHAGTFAADSGPMKVGEYTKDWLAAIEATIRPSTHGFRLHRVDRNAAHALGGGLIASHDHSSNPSRSDLQRRNVPSELGPDPPPRSSPGSRLHRYLPDRRAIRRRRHDRCDRRIPAEHEDCRDGPGAKRPGSAGSSPAEHRRPSRPRGCIARNRGC